MVEQARPPPGANRREAPAEEAAPPGRARLEIVTSLRRRLDITPEAVRAAVISSPVTGFNRLADGLREISLRD